MPVVEAVFAAEVENLKADQFKPSVLLFHLIISERKGEKL
jgi:hypothetical protein